VTPAAGSVGQNKSVSWISSILWTQQITFHNFYILSGGGGGGGD
jgi:hypothetical protein